MKSILFASVIAVSALTATSSADAKGCIKGAVVGGVVGLAVSGWLLAGELLARPLEAHGLDRVARRAVLRGQRARVLGFGVATQACFLVPLGAVAVMPAAVVGSTMLARDLLTRPESRADPAHDHLFAGPHWRGPAARRPDRTG